MGDERACRFCERADCERTKDNLIRCVFHHDWTSPHGHCPDYIDQEVRLLMMKIAAGEMALKSPSSVRKIKK